MLWLTADLFQPPLAQNQPPVVVNNQAAAPFQNGYLPIATLKSAAFKQCR